MNKKWVIELTIGIGFLTTGSFQAWAQSCQEACGEFPSSSTKSAELSLDQIKWRHCCKKNMGKAEGENLLGLKVAAFLTEDRSSGQEKEIENLKKKMESKSRSVQKSKDCDMYAPGFEKCGCIPRDLNESKIWSKCVQNLKTMGKTKAKKIDCNGAPPKGQSAAEFYEYCELEQIKHAQSDKKKKQIPYEQLGQGQSDQGGSSQKTQGESSK